MLHARIFTRRAHRQGLPSDAFQPNLSLSVSVICSATAPLPRDTSRIFAWFAAAHARPPPIPFSNYTHTHTSLPALFSAACMRARAYIYKLVFKSISQKWHVRAKLANILPLNWGYRQVLPIMLHTLRLRLHHKRQRVCAMNCRRRQPLRTRIKEWSEREKEGRRRRALSIHYV
jgi:hypothetical protein